MIGILDKEVSEKQRKMEKKKYVFLRFKIASKIRKNNAAASISRHALFSPPYPHPLPPKKHLLRFTGGHECLSGMFNLRKRSVFGSAVGSRNRSANPIAFSLVPRLSSSCSGNKFNGMVNTTDRRVHRNPKP